MKSEIKFPGPTDDNGCLVALMPVLALIGLVLAWLISTVS